MDRINFKGTKLFFLIIIILIIVLAIYKWFYKSEIENTIAVKNNTRLETKSYSKLKHDNLFYFEKRFDSSNISLILFEYRNNNTREALIIRRDSLTCIISQFNTDVVNSFFNDSVAVLSFDLLNILDKQIYKIPTEEVGRGFIKIKRRDLTVFVRTSDEKVLKFKINRNNQDEAIYKNILDLMINLINKINNSAISIEQLIANPKQN